MTGIANAKLKIPAGAGNHPETATLRIPTDVQILGFLPHMHLRGRAARYELVNSGGTEVLLDVPRYDFNWQLCYRLAEPRRLSAGDTIRYTSWYDNSADNPANPDPTRTVGWGQQTDDEMHLGYVEYFVPGEIPDKHIRSTVTEETGAGRGSGEAGEKLFRRLDIDGDGYITRAEVRKRLPGDKRAAGSTFDRLDGDRNDRIDKSELSRL